MSSDDGQRYQKHFVVVVILFLFDLTLASKIDLVETNLNRIFKLLTVYVYVICIFQC